jgi:NADPH-dependent 2,4-dienoyl-CoA reductase/sulfur reductase-like enzyme
VTEFVVGVERDEDGGLPVDERLRVADGVWAAGDVARYPDAHTARTVRIEHWRLAQQHGRSAAADMAGSGGPFTGVPFFWTRHFDLSLGHAGVVHQGVTPVVLGDIEGRDFTALYADDDRLLAACGTQPDELAAFLELMRLDALPALSELRDRERPGLRDLLKERAGS